ncbi:hypothetical protein PRIPAC_82583 [Pristionchus pacificus]|uniref:ShK domain-containing protein n=1 Tax=Pristionchus pacificus TaxID=54126 RepID=A0A2A6C4F5_PRIPA|nr:hypothetical protein PRIPAC_82583 [Pristionchus pacificus]|eukprot:PDM73019.1 ShK domain-containing protein [Pristionchus pacificus]
MELRKVLAFFHKAAAVVQIWQGSNSSTLSIFPFSHRPDTLRSANPPHIKMAQQSGNRPGAKYKRKCSRKGHQSILPLIMHFLLLSLLPAMASAVTDFTTCDNDPSLACFDTTECTAPATCAADAAGAAPAAGALGCCNGGATTTTTAATTVASATTTKSSTSCVDLLNPLTGVSDCPARASLCTNTVYLDVMRVQCSKTCGFCTSSGSFTNSTTSTTSCVDRVNPYTNISDCPNMRIYCNNTIYKPLMTIQCPATCGFCTSG